MENRQDKVFPKNRLHFHEKLGSGAFGNVYRAEARGILNPKELTVVAVKVLKGKLSPNYNVKFST